MANNEPSRFLATDTGAVFLTEYAEYLKERGCDMADFPGVMYADKNLGFNLEDGTDFLVEGWAFMVRGPDGQPDPEKLHMRVCNYGNRKLYFGKSKETRKLAGPGDKPKFVQIFKEEFLHYTRPREDICHAPVVMIHEKITSAMLATKYLGFPGVALSGCAGWSKGGKINKQLEFLIKNLEQSAKILVCFDGDVSYKHGIQEAARGLKGWVKTLRPDLSIVFLQVPENEKGNGWDDWVVSKGIIAAAEWPVEIMRQGDGIEITEFVPASFLIEEYQLTVTEGVDGKVTPQHTLDNYVRLTRYPRWAQLAVDISSQIYDRENIDAGNLDFEGIVREYRKWLETNVFRGKGAGTVRVNYAKDAITELLYENEVSVPHLLLARQPEVTKDQAYAAAEKLVTDGIRVTGPMPIEQTVETMVRMSRDMVALWSTNDHIDVQWACALVGPSGCGKSNFPKSFVAALSDWGYRPRVAQLPKEGSKSHLDELYKACRDSLIGVFDEYNPADGNARQVEQNIFTLSTTRTTDGRKLHQEYASKCTRHSSIFLTTVDTNRTYIRSSKGAGERRFITFEVVGVKYHDGKLSSDREVIKQCGATLLRYGYQLYCEGHKNDATEFSASTASEYIGESNFIAKVAKFWAKGDFSGSMAQFRTNYERKSGIKFSSHMLLEQLLPGEKTTRIDLQDATQLAIEAGAAGPTKTLCNKLTGGEVLKDKAYSVEDWEAFVQHIESKL